MMPAPRHLLLLATCIACGGASAARGGDAPDAKAQREAIAVAENKFSLGDLLPTAWQKRPNVRFNVYTSLTPEGRKRAEPSSAKPLYYTAPPGTVTNPGWMTTAGEKIPPWEQLEETMRKALAENGYLPVNEKHTRPDVLIVFTFGSHFVDLASLGDITAVTADELLPLALGNMKAIEDVIERARFIGGEAPVAALRQALKEEVENADFNALMVRSGSPARRPVSPDPGSPFVTLLSVGSTEAIRNVVELAFHTCYFVTATAYDFKAVEKRQRIALWQTRMTVEAQGLDVREVLKPLIVNTGPFLGRETPEAVTVRKRIDREGAVEIGTAEVVREPQPSAPSTSTPPAGNR